MRPNLRKTREICTLLKEIDVDCSFICGKKPRLRLVEARVRLQKYFARHKHKNGEIEHCEQFKHEICYEVSTRSLEIRFAGT